MIEVDAAITRLVAWLSRPLGFLATCFTVAIGFVLGAMIEWSDHWQLSFTLYLSVLAILQAGLILVAGTKDTAALQIKVDSLIAAIEKADNRLIGAEHKTLAEIDSIKAISSPP